MGRLADNFGVNNGSADGAAGHDRSYRVDELTADLHHLVHGPRVTEFAVGPPEPGGRECGHARGAPGYGQFEREPTAKRVPRDMWPVQP